RRRHTRSYGDWSSDVCSSDLGIDVSAVLKPVSKDAASVRSVAPFAPMLSREASTAEVVGSAGDSKRSLILLLILIPGTGQDFARSEERRVGKECRSRLPHDLI